MNSQKILIEINDLLSLFVLRVKTRVASGLYDQNKISENIIAPILGELLDLPDLKNLNEFEKVNYPGVDLADKGKRTAIQVTSTRGLQKIKSTLDTFFRHELDHLFGRLYFYILTEKQKSYSANSISQVVKNGFDFNSERDVLDFNFISENLTSLSFESLVKIHRVLYQELSIIESLQSKPYWLDDAPTTSGKNDFSENDKEFILRQVELLMSQEKLDEAVVYLREKLKLFKYDVQIRFSLASVYYGGYRYRESLNVINEGLNIEPENSNLLILKASVLAEIGRDTDTINCFLEAKEIYEKLVHKFDKWEYFFNYGNVLNYLDDNENARKMYEASIELDSSHPQVHCNLGNMYHKLGLHDLELSSFDNALKVFPAHVTTLVNKAVTLMMEYNQTNESLQLFERAIQIDREKFNKMPHGWYWMAFAYYVKRELSASLRALDSGLLIYPESSYFVNLKSKVLLELATIDSSYFNDCKIFMEKYLCLQPMDNVALEYINLLVKFNDESSAWNVVDVIVELSNFDFKFSDLLKEVGFSLSNVSRALKYLGLYKEYREQRPLIEYSHQELDLTLHTMFMAVTSLPFGLACNYALEKNFIDTAEHLKISEILISNLSALSKLSRLYFESIEVKDASIEEVESIVNNFLLAYTDIVEPEIIKQHVWINRLLGVEENLESINLEELMPSNIAEASLLNWEETIIQTAKNTFATLAGE